MRLLNEINDYSDIYQSVSDDDIREVESLLAFAFPGGYKGFVRDPDIEVVKRLPSLLWFVRHPSVGILDVNLLLRDTDHDPYPDRLVAFATNECGDYFCFDRDTGRIVYVDPDRPVEDSLESEELVYESFERWLDDRLRSRP